MPRRAAVPHRVIVSPGAYRPRAGASPLARVSSWLLTALGWRVVLVEPLPERCVVIFYPHTSNWDFPVGLLTKWAVAMRIHWVGKDCLFRWPLGALLRRLGGIAVNRRERTQLVERLAADLAHHPMLRVVIAPEGTRSRTEHWKSGFYHLALAARVPLALAFIDYGRREVGVGGYLTLTGDAAADMAEIAAFYAGRVGRHPALQGPVRLREDVGAVER